MRFVGILRYSVAPPPLHRAQQLLARQSTAAASDRREHATDMEPSPVARPQPLHELPHGEAQIDGQTTDNASSEPCYIDDVTTTAAEKVTAATTVDPLQTTTTAAVTSVDENNPTAMRAADESHLTAVTAADANNSTAVTAADEEVIAAAAPATLQITTDEKVVTATARVSEVSFVRQFKRIFFLSRY